MVFRTWVVLYIGVLLHWWEGREILAGDVHPARKSRDVFYFSKTVSALFDTVWCNFTSCIFLHRFFLVPKFPCFAGVCKLFSWMLALLTAFHFTQSNWFRLHFLLPGVTYF